MWYNNWTSNLYLRLFKPFGPNIFVSYQEGIIQAVRTVNSFSISYEDFNLAELDKFEKRLALYEFYS
jgi:hypothetical protein